MVIVIKTMSVTGFDFYKIIMSIYYTEIIE